MHIERSNMGEFEKVELAVAEGVYPEVNLSVSCNSLSDGKPVQPVKVPETLYARLARLFVASLPEGYEKIVRVEIFPQLHLDRVRRTGWFIRVTGEFMVYENCVDIQSGSAFGFGVESADQAIAPLREKIEELFGM